jgi:hypothetical protein
MARFRRSAVKSSARCRQQPCQVGPSLWSSDGGLEGLGPDEGVRVAVADHRKVDVVGAAAAGQHGVELLPELSTGHHPMHRVGRHALRGMHSRGVTQLGSSGDIAGRGASRCCRSEGAAASRHEHRSGFRLRTVHRSPFFTESVVLIRGRRSLVQAMIRSPMLAWLPSRNSISRLGVMPARRWLRARQHARWSGFHGSVWDIELRISSGVHATGLRCSPRLPARELCLGRIADWRRLSDGASESVDGRRFPTARHRRCRSRLRSRLVGPAIPVSGASTAARKPEVAAVDGAVEDRQINHLRLVARGQLRRENGHGLPPGLRLWAAGRCVGAGSTGDEQY